VTDTAGLLGRLDELVRQVDDLPVLNAVAQAAATRRLSAPAATSTAADLANLPWWQATLQRSWEVVRDEARGLVRVSRIDQPEAILLAPTRPSSCAKTSSSSCSMPAWACWHGNTTRPGPTWRPPPRR
jgi:uncharacterized protein HemX